MGEEKKDLAPGFLYECTFFCRTFKQWLHILKSLLKGIALELFR
jgi:hypothetical protein